MCLDHDKQSDYLTTCVFPETSCANGFYATGGAVTCTECPAGSRCPDKSLAPSQCTLGSYASTASMTCTSCEAGYYCANAGMSAPVACPAGSYQTATGQSSCSTCLAGESIVSLSFTFCFLLCHSVHVFHVRLTDFW